MLLSATEFLQVARAHAHTSGHCAYRMRPGDLYCKGEIASNSRVKDLSRQDVRRYMKCCSHNLVASFSFLNQRALKPNIFEA
jgi:hypothetical protein